MPRALAEGLPDLGDASQASFSALEERRLGEEIMREVRADRAYYDDAEATDYVNALGNRLVSRGADSAAGFPVLPDAGPPDQRVRAARRLRRASTPACILAAQSESEVASVMAHEIAHVTQRHIARIIDQQKQSTVHVARRARGRDARGALEPRRRVGRDRPRHRRARVQNMLNFTRDHEREADRVGLQILDGAGYDPRAMAVFFERLQRATRMYEVAARRRTCAPTR